ncbi:MAG: hypothetical protein AB9856_10025 [Cellulosilyticaceae bacterium]
MKTKTNVHVMVTAALLCAIGILIPMVSPIKIILEPASFTLASHVAIWIAMFISPSTAVFVALGTTAGFFIGGFPPAVVLRALSHVIFAFCGAYFLKKAPATLEKTGTATIYALVLSIIHAIGEVLIVMPLYMGNGMSQAYYDKGIWYSIFGLVGAGTIIHSMVDFGISIAVWKVVAKYTYLNKKLNKSSNAETN